ncbi:hypothetical protein [Agrobacterium tumefaciens]|nr:hypothetical protein [Agrobacterium tumefaciens]MDS7596214.1 hypothetical protein [Agrobacterium tumefaciens]
MNRSAHLHPVRRPRAIAVARAASDNTQAAFRLAMIAAGALAALSVLLF